ncbi:AraC family transcriptional regulator [Dictyobacter sp. S3.2.2.5]|uniref:AraC family transcriptional regulator n=1 Tax=Dictyobacter halimunensis TaxID=3026934 RepID=A0ABQ6FIW7_9CHLR|nr:AraC family transcriptional regulator [Dictyobacter sp. S3.2.2.5]
MDERDGHQRERQTVMQHAYREELVERIGRVVREDGVEEPLPGLHLARSSVPFQPIHSVVEPSICVIAQGSKEVLLGESRYCYDPEHYLLTTIELPRVSQVLSASKERPYLSLRLDLAPSLVSSVVVEADYTWLKPHTAVSAITVSPLDENLLEAFVRLVRLVDSPAHAQVLGPLITQEILYWLLVGEQGSRLRHLALQGGYTPDIVQTVKRLRQHFDQPLRIEEIAQDLGMSVSGFHHHFKAVTALSPLQFQKQLRLQEARRLMLSENLDATSAAYRVGYQDAAYFNREYKSLFGVPPIRDVQRLREEALAFPNR